MNRAVGSYAAAPTRPRRSGRRVVSAIVQILVLAAVCLLYLVVVSRGRLFHVIGAS